MKMRNPVTWERVRNLSAILGVANILLLGFVSISLKKVREVISPGARLSISCPMKIYMNEVEVFGDRSSNLDQVELFVGPLDGSDAYFAQGKADNTSVDHRAWAKTARLGNPYGLGHRKKPPLDYDIVAVLRNTNNSTEVDQTQFPGKGLPFENWIAAQPGIRAVASCRISRMPELAILCADMPHITSPTQNCCPFNTNGHLCMSSVPEGGTTAFCNPTILKQVHSPVVLEWSRNLPMYVQLHQTPPGKPVDGFPKMVDKSGTSILLPPGTYEVKIQREENCQCISSSWFEVVAEQ
jgi:hypothetical protein